ncbi:hypothetical protein [Halomonas halodenitrificans]|uniref:hypothetical protein n=1 Tax=Halomonas halodenitrificans TaxID=28252 RepID=UPI000482D8C1|nr:hypothetical protein [Halomonas halodenitrificans]
MILQITKDEKKLIYSVIYDEIASEKIDSAIWTQSFSESGGDINKARSIYIKHRYKEIEDEVVARKKEAAKRHEENEETKRKESEKLKNKAKEAAARIEYIERNLPFAKFEAENAESRFKEGEQILENLLNRERELVESAANSHVFIKKIKHILLGRIRGKINKEKHNVKILMKEKEKVNAVFNNYKKELRDIEQQFGR